MVRKAHSYSIPASVEYLGLNEWAVRWDVQVDTDRETEDDITHYVYNEEVYNQEPSYELFVSNRIRDVYTNDQEAALKSNMISVFIDSAGAVELSETSKAAGILAEWKAFEAIRNEAKAFGREIFNIEE